MIIESYRVAGDLTLTGLPGTTMSFGGQDFPIIAGSITLDYDLMLSSSYVYRITDEDGNAVQTGRLFVPGQTETYGGEIGTPIQGPPGPPGADSSVPGPAGSDGDEYAVYADPAKAPAVTGILSGERIVRSNGTTLVYADPDSTLSTLWLTTAALSAGPISGRDLLANGLYQSDALSLTAGPVYLSAGGHITQVAPISGVVRPVGYAISATVIEFNPKPGITL